MVTGSVVTLSGAATVSWVTGCRSAGTRSGCAASPRLGVAGGYTAFVMGLRIGELSFVATLRYSGIPMAMLWASRSGATCRARRCWAAAADHGLGPVHRLGARRAHGLAAAEHRLPLSMPPQARQHRPRQWREQDEPSAGAAHRAVRHRPGMRRRLGGHGDGRRESSRSRPSTPCRSSSSGCSRIHKALNAAKDARRDRVRVLENVANADYERVMREYAEEGNKLIVGEAFAVEAAARKVAKDYPEDGVPDGLQLRASRRRRTSRCSTTTSRSRPT